MRRGTDSIQNGSLRVGGQQASQGTEPSNTSRLATLAALTLARQTPGLVLPALVNIPTSYTHTQGGDTALALAGSLVQLGLGSADLWRRHHANPSLFIRSALNEWLEALGGAALDENVSIDFAIVDDLDGVRPEHGKLFILLETSDGCGFLAIGNALDRLEQEEAGLGRSFYIVLSKTMNQWMYIYDIARTEYFLDQWKESIEMDIEDGDGSEASFELYCKENDVIFPDLVAATPPCIRDINFHRESRRIRRHIDLLKRHRQGKYADWIEPVLAIAAVTKPKQGLHSQEIDGVWDDEALPNWVVAFEPHDPVTQAFDEERQHMYESSHAPTWIDAFDPSKVTDVKRVLSHVQNMVRVNRQLVDLARSLERSSDLASTDQPQFNNELRAA